MLSVMLSRKMFAVVYTLGCVRFETAACDVLSQKFRVSLFNFIRDRLLCTSHLHSHHFISVRHICSIMSFISAQCNIIMSVRHICRIMWVRDLQAIESPLLLFSSFIVCSFMCSFICPLIFSCICSFFPLMYVQLCESAGVLACLDIFTFLDTRTY